MTVDEWAKDFRSFVNELKMPRDDYKGIMEYIDDALALLKDKEPAEPVMKKGRLFTAQTCRKCGYFFPTGTKPNYCQECGQAVKWK